mmetsp:Transcript_814/g.1157  ORF Transcript_814/g.1157 Transcript_814/m.1157 type:complete len:80 (-) Transcript_814:106-345(-)
MLSPGGKKRRKVEAQGLGTRYGRYVSARVAARHWSRCLAFCTVLRRNCSSFWSRALDAPLAGAWKRALRLAIRAITASA